MGNHFGRLNCQRCRKAVNTGSEQHVFKQDGGTMLWTERSNEMFGKAEILALRKREARSGTLSLEQTVTAGRHKCGDIVLSLISNVVIQVVWGRSDIHKKRTVELKSKILDVTTAEGLPHFEHDSREQVTKVRLQVVPLRPLLSAVAILQPSPPPSAFAPLSRACDEGGDEATIAAARISSGIVHRIENLALIQAAGFRSPMITRWLARLVAWKCVATCKPLDHVTDTESDKQEQEVVDNVSGHSTGPNNFLCGRDSPASLGRVVFGVPCLERALEHKPHNILLVLVGPGILWSDWNGFNGGGPYAASTDASAAVLNTNIATAMSALVWIMWDTIYYKKPSVLGGVNDMTAGLVAIAPAAGVVAGWGAIILWTSEGDAAFNINNPVRSIDGNGKQIGWIFVLTTIQATYCCLFCHWMEHCWTSRILLFIKHVLRMPLRMSEVDLVIGDDAIHGEDAYSLDHPEKPIDSGGGKSPPVDTSDSIEAV
ncbi:hypothetical protein BS47DRAFT_1363726 [Hydnum rufescens UP504]|uniref:Ammonium transporter AmtB-like domain-containing protein n=1 Tax=Hydnum rufescens UP504 TaxID=1448309 RepID=A0A9P6DUF8_9AGAM|nr:hypothetical protein BS47DRAFT_1363726 [Hydnum rufescens UP504]